MKNDSVEDAGFKTRKKRSGERQSGFTSTKANCVSAFVHLRSLLCKMFRTFNAQLRVWLQRVFWEGYP